MKSDWSLQISVCEKQGLRRYNMAVDLGVETFGERLADDMRGGLAFAGPGAFDAAASVLKSRQFRRDLLIAAARQLGARLADYLEDREGWHGIDRQETALQIEARSK